MAEYHVSCGISAIYTGKAAIVSEDGIEWFERYDVTNEAIKAVICYLYKNRTEDDVKEICRATMSDGNHVELSLKIVNERE